MNQLRTLIAKYNQPVPRYTSYPTVPFWQERVDPQAYLARLAGQFNRYNASEGLSLYIHLPFCESLCTYCGCNKKITRNHGVEDTYIKALLQEFALYRQRLPAKPVIRELHLGGGTPTFFSPQNLSRLLSAILSACEVHEAYDFSVEGHPNNTTPAHLQTLSALGFRRISYGVQDLDYAVQRAINRIQPFLHVKSATEAAREAGFQSVNFDLIYGLPFQTLASITDTMEKCIGLKPDRIAFYSYAHVPWTSRGQRLFDETDLPQGEEKLNLYLKGQALLKQAGYVDVGMDHFAWPGDGLCTAAQSGRLHRNFMGYTTQPSPLLLGLGVSAISDTGNAYAQNHKSLHDYYASVAAAQLPLGRGFLLDEEDLRFRAHIKHISCQGNTSVSDEDRTLLNELAGAYLQTLENDGLIRWQGAALQVTAVGRQFIRNICRAFDLHLLRRQQSEAQAPAFSQAI